MGGDAGCIHLSRTLELLVNLRWLGIWCSIPLVLNGFVSVFIRVVSEHTFCHHSLRRFRHTGKRVRPRPVYKAAEKERQARAFRLHTITRCAHAAWGKSGRRVGNSGNARYIVLERLLGAVRAHVFIDSARHLVICAWFVSCGKSVAGT